MPGKKKSGPSVEDPKVYEIREQGGSKEKAARNANAAAGTRPGPGLERRAASPVRTRTGRSITCTSVPGSWAYRATPASTNPNWCPC
jgi:hypothetical protein